MKTLYTKKIKTKLGTMLAVADDKNLLFLDFEDSKHFKNNFSAIKEKNEILEKSNNILDQTEKELLEYFSGNRKKFTIPVEFSGTDFQRKVWNELLKIPFGETKFYQQQAQSLGDEKKVRAVANANGKNRISIVVPCHRVLGKNGTLTGYAGGIDRKKYLLELEKQK